MTNKPVIIIGSGSHASVLVETLFMNKREVIGFTEVVDIQNKFNLTYLGNDEIISNYDAKEVELVIGLGSIKSNKSREKIYEKYKRKGFKFAQVIHPSAIVSSYADLAEGVQVLAGAIIQAFVKVKENVIVNTGASIDHDCVIEAHCHLSPGVTCAGGVQIKKNSHIGIGAILLQNIEVGDNSTIGAGAVVTRDVQSGVTVIGIPAKEVTT